MPIADDRAAAQAVVQPVRARRRDSFFESSIPRGMPLARQDHRGGDHRPGERPAAGLVDPGDGGEAELFVAIQAAACHASRHGG